MVQLPRHVITIYDATTGAIRCWGMCVVGDEVVNEGEAWIEGGHDNTYVYIDPQTLEPVPLLTFDVEIVGNQITGIPAGTEAYVWGQMEVVDDGELTIEVEDPLEVRVTLHHPLYTPLTLEVNCEPN